MKDVLLPVGTIVRADIPEIERHEATFVLIIGKRQVKRYKAFSDNEYSYKAFDYIGVAFPEGITEATYYFNHPDIVETVREIPDILYTRK